MKRNLITAIGLMASLLVMAGPMTGVKIYINPGHGGWGSDDRNMVVYPFKQGDHEGFWESKSNLQKGLMLDTLLRSFDCTTMLSRTENEEVDDRALSAIVAEANTWNADYMLANHSNAGSGTSNYCLQLYAGIDPGDNTKYPTATPVSDKSRAISTVIAQCIYDNEVTCWSYAGTRVSGDKTFARQIMGWSDGYGVLRGLRVPGCISEARMHDYTPETYRMLNLEYQYIESWQFAQAFCRYFKNYDMPHTIIAGSVKDSYNKNIFPSMNPLKNTRDELRPICGATVLLVQGTDTIGRYTTDQLYNGVYGFRNIQAGDYKLICRHPNYYEAEKQVTVTANKICYCNFDMDMARQSPPEVLSRVPAVTSLTDSVECSTDIVLNFNWDVLEDSARAAFSISPAVEGTISFENSQKTLRFHPTNGLQTATVYTVSLSTTLCHPDTRYSNHLVASWSFQFVTKSRGLLSVVGTYPPVGATDVPVNPSFIILFDQKVDNSTANTNLSVLDAAGNEVTKNSRSLTYNKAPQPYGYVSFELVNALEPDADYTLVIKPGIADQVGIVHGETTTVAFHTAAAPEVDAVVNNMDALAFTYDESQSVSVKSASTLRNTTSKKYSGTACNEFKYVFQDGTTDGQILYTAIDPSALSTTADYALGMFLFGNFSGNRVEAQFSVDGDIRYVPIATLDYAGWRYVRVPLNTLPAGVSYQLTGLRLSYAAQAANGSSLPARRRAVDLAQSGSFYVDDMTLAYDGTSGTADKAATAVRFDGRVLLNPNYEHLILFDIQGRMLMTGFGDMDLSTMPAGIYLVRTAGGMLKVVK